MRPGFDRPWNPKLGPPEVVTDRPAQVIRGHGSDVVSAVFLTHDGRGPVLTCADVTLRVFDPARTGDSRVLATGTGFGFTGGFGPGSGFGGGLAFTPDGRTLAAVVDGRTQLFEADTGKPAAGLPLDPTPVTAMALSADGKWVAEGLSDRLRVRPVGGGEGARSWEARRAFTLGCAFAPGGDRLAACAADGTFGVWEVPAGRKVWSAKAPLTTAVAWHPHGKTLATCGTDRVIRLWAAADGKPGRTFEGHTHFVNQVVFDRDGTRLASASSDNTTRVWDVATGRQLLMLRTRDHYIHSVAFSPDGERLADASGDGVVTVYDARTGQDAITLKGHAGLISRIVFSPDGARLATTGEDRTVRLWDAPPDAAAEVPPWADKSFDPAGKSTGRK